MFSLWITMCNKSAMCKLPENSTILGYGLSYESDLTRGLSNSELQQKINELHQPRVQSPPGVYRCIVCGQPLQAEERATEKRACHSDCAKFLDRIIQIVSSAFNMKPNGAPIDLTVDQITADRLGKAFESGQAYENRDGTPFIVDTDFLNLPRHSRTLAGPFAAPQERVQLF